MSYQGGLDYMPMDTVDEVADYTDMMGQASIANQAKVKNGWRTDATKSLIALWLFIVLLYLLLMYFFRRNLA